MTRLPSGPAIATRLALSVTLLGIALEQGRGVALAAGADPHHHAAALERAWSRLDAELRLLDQLLPGPEDGEPAAPPR